MIPIFMYVYMRAAAENSKLVVIISYRSRQCFFDKDEEEEYLRTYQPTYLPIYCTVETPTPSDELSTLAISATKTALLKEMPIGIYTIGIVGCVKYTGIVDLKRTFQIYPYPYPILYENEICLVANHNDDQVPTTYDCLPACLPSFKYHAHHVYSLQIT